MKLRRMIRAIIDARAASEYWGYRVTAEFFIRHGTPRSAFKGLRNEHGR